jgi:hypothetical protein
MLMEQLTNYIGMVNNLIYALIKMGQYMKGNICVALCVENKS